MSSVVVLLPSIIVAALVSADPADPRGAGDAPRAGALADPLDGPPGAPAAEARSPVGGSTRMDEPMENRPEYAWLREFKKAHGWDLMRRYGAHGLGIGWKRENGRKTNQLALVFYVDRNSTEDRAAGPTIPPAFTFTPADADAPVSLPTDVVETPAATLEAE
jgi:hypothetical protein